MKKTIALFLAVLTLLALGACGGAKTAPAAAETTVAPAAEMPAQTTAEPAAAATAEPTQETSTTAELDQAAYDAAMACIGQPVDALYAAVGQPDSSVYGTSCLEQGAEDGTLFYNALGFSVWTVRNADGETVHDVLVIGE